MPASAPPSSRPVRLLAPLDGSRTAPLQQHAWPEEREQYILAARAAAPSPCPDLGLPRAVNFRWQPLKLGRNHASFELLLSPSPDFHSVRRVAPLPAPQASLAHLLLDTRYYWKVRQYSGGELVGESPVWSFQTHPAPPRWIHVPGIPNVRDLGGWPAAGGRRVRQGLIYRSAEFNTHTQLPPEGRQVLQDELGIRTDLDLRGTAEDEAPAPGLDPTRVDWQPCPFYAYNDLFTQPGQQATRLAFSLLAQPPRYPILVHCWAGADRTGTLALLLNGLLGVGLEDLIHDYELTSLTRMGLRLHSDDRFQELLEGLETYGSQHASLRERIRAYLLASGVTPTELYCLEEMLLEEC